MTAKWMCKSHNEHIKWAHRPNIFHICAKTQPTAIHTSHGIAKYVLQTNMTDQIGQKCHIFDRLILEGVYAYICHI